VPARAAVAVAHAWQRLCRSRLARQLLAVLLAHRHFGHYNATYGSLVAAIGMMTWMWISMIVILVGAQLNAETEQQSVRETTVRPDEPLEERGARKANTIGSRN
jgi:uncharacterized BrkB/YihY/UPF0761 family membrane protein